MPRKINATRWAITKTKQHQVKNQRNSVWNSKRSNPSQSIYLYDKAFLKPNSGIATTRRQCFGRSLKIHSWCNIMGRNQQSNQAWSWWNCWEDGHVNNRLESRDNWKSEWSGRKHSRVQWRHGVCAIFREEKAVKDEELEFWERGRVWRVEGRASE